MSLLAAVRNRHLKHRHRIRRLVHSLFTKLLLVLLITGVLLNLVIGGFFRNAFREGQKLPWQANLEQYLLYLTDDLGHPPELTKAQILSQKLFVDIRYESPSVQWQTNAKLPAIDQLFFHPMPGSSSLFVGRTYHEHYLIFKRSPGRFLFSLSRRPSWEFFTSEWVLGVLGLISLIVILTYFGLRWLLSPIKWLHEGVRSIQRGNFDYQIPARRKDELGELASAFNEMTAQIRQMLHAKERLLLDVSHELRSPVTRAKVALEFLEENETTQSIRADLHEIETMITEILETARLQNTYGELKREQTELLRLIQEILQEDKIWIQRVCLEGMPIELSLDRHRMQVVIRNLLDNALKYSQESAPIYVRIQCMEDFIWIEVQDQGMGIPEEELPYIFEPFYRLDRSRSKKTGGYGLGLSLCKTIVEAHQGQIEIKSQVGVGTTVRVKLPLENKGRSD